MNKCVLPGEREVFADAGGNEYILQLMEAPELSFEVLKICGGDRILPDNITGFHERRDALDHLGGNMSSDGRNVHLFVFISEHILEEIRRI